MRPADGGDVNEVKKLRAFWEALGSNVDGMDADHQDLVGAGTAHTPHLIAYTVVGVADDRSRVTDTEVVNF